MVILDPAKEIWVYQSVISTAVRQIPLIRSAHAGEVLSPYLDAESDQCQCRISLLCEPRNSDEVYNIDLVEVTTHKQGWHLCAKLNELNGLTLMSPSKKSTSVRGRSTPGRPERAKTDKDDTTLRRSAFPIVGIGASAGGLEAFTSLLKALSPNLGMAFVFVPHLDPSRESAFTQILPRATSMPVLQAKEGMRVEANHIYVIPPNRDLTIADSILHVAHREEPRSVNTAIDIFFRSLANDQGRNAIGVILSGTASDGTLGLTAIKGEGGITFAQDTSTAKYDGMPASAIAADCVDFVLPPEGIATELARIRKHPYVAGSQMEQSDQDAKGFDTHLSQVFRLLRRATKVDFSEYKPPTIGRRIQRRMALHKIEQISEYVALLHRDRAEVNALYQDLLINVTSFFRNPEAFDTLKQIVYPAMLQARGSTSSPIRIWVPGCYTPKAFRAFSNEQGGVRERAGTMDLQGCRRATRRPNSLADQHRSEVSWHNIFSFDRKLNTWLKSWSHRLLRGGCGRRRRQLALARSCAKANCYRCFGNRSFPYGQIAAKGMCSTRAMQLSEMRSALSLSVSTARTTKVPGIPTISTLSC